MLAAFQSKLSDTSINLVCSESYAYSTLLSSKIVNGVGIDHSEDNMFVDTSPAEL